MLTHILRALLCALALAWLLPASAASDPSSDTEVWKNVRASLFDGRDIVESTDVVELEAPFRAEDAAVVPVVLRAKIDQKPDYYIRRMWLVIDGNPTPVAAAITIAPEAGRADIETRVRVEQYTWMRAIAETSDGKLHASSRFVRASGGCSAPAGKDVEEAMARLGRMKIKVDAAASAETPASATVMVSHPNLNGMQMDQVTRLFTPAHFVRRIEVSYAGQTLLTADVDFALSENPQLRFHFRPQDGGELQARVIDSRDLTFTQSVAVQRAPVASTR
ncbi:quinoprotein dehydrogenase-associated SoxYZ-like carrier [Methyloversatilis thermotolerans]|uniref:quinoprotein dehydrogenase-associated SoxYZ-like carrier n=1 Tax=Methyloversatilis thermotolerans TaxID=1346290 RepID=UPI00039F1F0A|nr:quinoprotein dehydrogenase-associated SoxYZ-like carrier [Methyloversatilis thermotolerans]